MASRDSEDEAERLRIFEQAATHFATMAGGGASAADREAMTAWLLADPRHAEAYANVERLWTSASEAPELKARGEEIAGRMTRRDLGKGVLAVGCLALGWGYLRTHPFADFRTGKGERRTERLPDGSTIELSAETTVSLDYTSSGRRIVLHAGEAYFTVAPDASRPFVVAAGEAEARALGTAFGMSLDGDQGELVVTRHAVELHVSDQRIKVDEGSRAAFDGSRIGAVEPSGGAPELAWREGRLVFVERPLGEAVAAINRWRPGRLVVVEPSLAARRVTIIVDLARLDALPPRLAAALPVRFVDVTPWLTLIFSAG